MKNVELRSHWAPALGPSWFLTGGLPAKMDVNLAEKLPILQQTRSFPLLTNFQCAMQVTLPYPFIP